MKVLTQLKMTKTTRENERLQAILKRKIQLLYTRTHTNTNTHACLLTSLYISANKTKQKKANAITQCNHQHKTRAYRQTYNKRIKQKNQQHCCYRNARIKQNKTNRVRIVKSFKFRDCFLGFVFLRTVCGQVERRSVEKMSQNSHTQS